MAASEAKLDVAQFLEEQTKHFKPIEVEKVIDLDLGHLLASDVNPIDIQQLRGDREEHLRSLARDNTQLLINEIWKLPTERLEDAVVAKLPAPLTHLPREKPLPKPKAPTKWELYAEKKGIVKKKRSRMVWDEVRKEWRPRYGYKRVNDDSDVWALPVPDNADPYEDQFEKRAEAKKERVAKNELQRLKNIARSQKGGIKSIHKALETTKLPPAKLNKDELTEAMAVAKGSTASVGKFTEKLRDEKAPKKTGRKRKFEAVVGDVGSERSKHLEFVSKIGSDKPIVNITKGVNQRIASDERGDDEPAAKRSKKAGAKGKGKKGGFKKSVASSKSPMKGKGKSQSGRPSGRGGKR